MNHAPNPDDANLPDHDYESIYGHEAAHARLLARLDALLRRMDERNAALAVRNRQWDTRLPPGPCEGGSA